MKRFFALLAAIVCVAPASQLMAQPGFIVAGDYTSDSICYTNVSPDTGLAGTWVDLNHDGTDDFHFILFLQDEPDNYEHELYIVGSDPGKTVASSPFDSGSADPLVAGDFIDKYDDWTTRSTIFGEFHDDFGGSGYWGFWHPVMTRYMGLRMAGPADTTYCWALIYYPAKLTGELMEYACTCDSVTIGVDPGATGSAYFNVYFDDSRDEVFVSAGDLVSLHPGLKVFDMQGKEMMHTSGDVYNQEWKCVMDVSAYPSGVYFLRLEDGEKYLTKRICIW